MFTIHNTDIIPGFTRPESWLTLSRMEVEHLHDASGGELGELLRCCVLAVLNSGSDGDGEEALLASFADFEIEVQQVIAVFAWR